MYASGWTRAVINGVSHLLDQDTGVTATTDEARRVWDMVLVVTVAQGLVGYVQYFTHLPEVLVLVHMLGASLLVVVLAFGVLATRRHPV